MSTAVYVCKVTKSLSDAIEGRAARLADLGDGWYLQWQLKTDSGTKYLGIFLSVPKKDWGSTIICKGELNHIDDIRFGSMEWEHVFSEDLGWGTPKMISTETLLENLKDDAFMLVLGSAVPSVDASRPQLSLSAARAINSSLISPSDERDIKFLNYNSKPQQDLLKRHVRESFSLGHILADRTTYFSSHAAFSEGVELTTSDATTLDSMPSFDASYDYLSDSDLDSGEEVEDEQMLDEQTHGHVTKPRGKEQPEPLADTKKWKVIFIGDIAHKTWVATLGFLYTDAICFASLSSKKVAKAAITDQAKLAFPQVSCKSVFRAADKLGIKKLEDLAFNSLESQIDDETIFHEIFSSFTGRYDRVRTMQFDYLVANWDRLQASNHDVLNQMLSDIGSGKRPGSVWLLQRLFENTKITRLPTT